MVDSNALNNNKLSSGSSADSFGACFSGIGFNKAAEQRVAQLLKATGYSLVHSNGQRRYGGPPPDWVGEAPTRGSEVFVGKLPRDILEDELVPVFEKVGRIYEMRHMMDFTGANRGFAYVRFTRPEHAQKAIDELNNHEIRPGHHIGVMMSVDNCRLFVGGIPKSKAREEVLVEMRKVSEGVVDVILKSSATDKSKNRGFAFVEYNSHRAAAMARRKLAPSKVQIWGQLIAVDWAEPEQDVDDATMQRVKILYVSNLMLRTSEQRIREVFERSPSSVERVKKIKDFAFVHFYRREDAEAALAALNGTELDGSIIGVEWAKPPDKSLLRYVKNVQKSGGLPTLPVVNHSGSVHQNIVAAATQLYSASACGFPLIEAGNVENGRGAAGMRMQRHAVVNAMRSFAADNIQKSAPFYDFVPGIALLPFDPLTMRPIKSMSQILDDYCIQYRWGLPTYQLQTTSTKDINDNPTQLHMYRVTVPALLLHFGCFLPGRLSANMDEAKELAAQHVLLKLGLPLFPTANLMSGIPMVPPSVFPLPPMPLSPVTSNHNPAFDSNWFYPPYFPFSPPAPSAPPVYSAIAKEETPASGGLPGAYPKRDPQTTEVVATSSAE